MISYDAQKQIFKLDTPNTSYLMGLADGRYLGHIYYGDALNSMDVGYLMRTGEPPFTPAGNQREKVSFLDCFPMEYPAGGIGDFRESCIEIRNKDGEEGVELWYKAHHIYEGKPALAGLPATWGAGCDTLELVLRDDVLDVEVILIYSVFRELDIITRSVKVSNESSHDLYIERLLSACLDMDNEDFEMLTLHGSWARERHIQRRCVGYGGTVAESIRGESGHQDHPFLALVSPDCTQTGGRVYGMHLVYSGNFLAKVQQNQFEQIRAVMGIHPEHFCWKLEPGEQFQAPEAVLCYSNEGLGKMTRNFHDLYRHHLIRGRWRDIERPVLINNWEATYFDFDTEKLLDIARTAAEHGIEMLVMDDGWFGSRNADNSSLGDWTVNEDKIKGGLNNLVEQVNALGLKFGIWFEPEMISPDSDLYRCHPEWVLRGKRREPGQCREQLVLDFSRPEVVDYVYESIATILRSANIEYVKWDMNRPLADIGSGYLPADRQQEAAHRHTLAVYQLQERLISEFPGLLLENCSGGGARFDPGMLYYSPQIWCSDDTDAVERLAIQEGTQLLYPLSCIGAHVSDCPNYATGRVTPFETRGAAALAGTFGYELDITRISERDREQIPKQIKNYKEFGGLIREGDYYRIASYRENHWYDCWQVVSKDKKSSLLTFVQVMAEANKKSIKIKLQGLLNDGIYDIDGKEYTGNILMHAGILIERPWGDYQSRMIRIEQRGEK